MPGPVLIVVTPDIALTPKVLNGLANATTVVLRSVSVSVSGVGWPLGAEAPSHVFFPVLTGTGPLMSVVQEWVGRAAPRALDLKVLLPQLVSAGYALMVADGLWHWYKPADSPPLASLTLIQVAKQLQTLGSMLEKMVV